MTQDIDHALRDWPFEPGDIIARLVTAADGRVVLQLRIDMGVIQMAPSGRPDGSRPGGHTTYLDYLRHELDDPDGTSALAELNTMTPEQCADADREFAQFYQRRLAWLALREYKGAVADAEHSLALMDLVARHSPSDEYTASHEKYRAFIVFQRTEAATALALSGDDPDAAVDALTDGLERMRQVYERLGVADRMGEDDMVRNLRAERRRLRKLHRIDKTLHEQLQEAIANEDYERAARIRDRIRARRPDNPSPDAP